MRLTPALAFILIAIVTTGDYLNHARPYPFLNDLVKPCENYWWSTLLHVQVQANPDELVRNLIIRIVENSNLFQLQCMQTTWYLSVDWQMFLLAPILIYPAWKFSRKILFIVLPALILVSNDFAYQFAIESKLLVRDFEM